MKVFGVHLIRTDTTKDGDGKPLKLYQSSQEARQFCDKQNTASLRDQSLMYCVRVYEVSGGEKADEPSYTNIIRKFDELVDLLEKADPNKLSAIQKYDMDVYTTSHLKAEVDRLLASDPEARDLVYKSKKKRITTA
jgi:hypothetical protein